VPVFVLSATWRAVTVPLLAVEPCTTAQSPTFTAELVTAAVVVYFVAAVTRTVPLETVIVEPPTAVTLPATTAPARAPLGNPLGRAPDGKPLRRAPDGNPLGRAPLGKPLGRVRPIPAQLPEVDGWIRTSVAVMSRAAADDGDGAAADEPDAVAAVAMMQDPTCTAARVVDFCWLKVVLADQVTAVCSVLLCTCIVLPLTSAISPEAAARNAAPAAPPPLPPAPVDRAAAVGPAPEADELPEQAASTSAPASRLAVAVQRAGLPAGRISII
jgi:hypothetical protein